MHHVGPQYSQGAVPSHHPPQYAPPEVSQPAGGGSNTSLLRQWRKKDYTEKQPTSEPPTTTVADSPSHVARVAPHTHYPRPPNDGVHYSQQQYVDYSLPYKPPAPVKYSEIVENQPAQRIEHITPVIPKHKEKEYVEMCNVQQPPPKQYQDHHHIKQTFTEPIKQSYADPQLHQYIPKEQQIHQYMSKQPQMHQYIQKEPQYQQYMPKYNIESQYARPYPTENNFLATLNKINPRMAQSIMNDTHLRDSQVMYHNLEPSRPYPQGQRMYHTNTATYAPQGPRSIPQPYGYNHPYNFNMKPTMQNVDSYNKMQTYQHTVPKYYQDYRVDQSVRDISPQRSYGEGRMNYAPMPQKVSPNYATCAQPEYAQHYQHRRQYPPEYYTQNFKGGYITNPSLSPESDLENRPAKSNALKQFIETFMDEESGVLPDIVVSNGHEIERVPVLKGSMRVKDPTTQEELYVLDSTEISTEHLQQFVHLQQFERLPENIRGFVHPTSDTIPMGPESRVFVENGGNMLRDVENIETSNGLPMSSKNNDGRINILQNVSYKPEMIASNGVIISESNRADIREYRVVQEGTAPPVNNSRSMRNEFVIENGVRHPVENYEKVVQIHIVDSEDPEAGEELSASNRHLQSRTSPTCIIKDNLLQESTLPKDELHLSTAPVVEENIQLPGENLTIREQIVHEDVTDCDGRNKKTSSDLSKNVVAGFPRRNIVDRENRYLENQIKSEEIMYNKDTVIRKCGSSDSSRRRSPDRTNLEAGNYIPNNEGGDKTIVEIENQKEAFREMCSEDISKTNSKDEIAEMCRNMDVLKNNEQCSESEVRNINKEMKLIHQDKVEGQYSSQNAEKSENTSQYSEESNEANYAKCFSKTVPIITDNRADLEQSTSKLPKESSCESSKNPTNYVKLPEPEEFCEAINLCKHDDLAQREHNLILSASRESPVNNQQNLSVGNVIEQPVIERENYAQTNNPNKNIPITYFEDDKSVLLIKSNPLNHETIQDNQDATQSLKSVTHGKILKNLLSIFADDLEESVSHVSVSSDNNSDCAEVESSGEASESECCSCSEANYGDLTPSNNERADSSTDSVTSSEETEEPQRENPNRCDEELNANYDEDTQSGSDYFVNGDKERMLSHENREQLEEEDIKNVKSIESVETDDRCDFEPDVTNEDATNTRHSTQSYEDVTLLDKDYCETVAEHNAQLTEDNMQEEILDNCNKPVENVSTKKLLAHKKKAETVQFSEDTDTSCSFSPDIVKSHKGTHKISNLQAELKEETNNSCDDLKHLNAESTTGEETDSPKVSKDDALEQVDLTVSESTAQEEIVPTQTVVESEEESSTNTEDDTEEDERKDMLSSNDDSVSEREFQLNHCDSVGMNEAHADENIGEGKFENPIEDHSNFVNSEEFDTSNPEENVDCFKEEMENQQDYEKSCKQAIADHLDDDEDQSANPCVDGASILSDHSVTETLTCEEDSTNQVAKSEDVSLKMINQKADEHLEEEKRSVDTDDTLNDHAEDDQEEIDGHQEEELTKTEIATPNEETVDNECVAENVGIKKETCRAAENVDCETATFKDVVQEFEKLPQEYVDGISESSKTLSDHKNRSTEYVVYGTKETKDVVHHPTQCSRDEAATENVDYDKEISNPPPECERVVDRQYTSEIVDGEQSGEGKIKDMQEMFHEQTALKSVKEKSNNMQYIEDILREQQIAENAQGLTITSINFLEDVKDILVDQSAIKTIDNITEKSKNRLDDQSTGENLEDGIEKCKGKEVIQCTDQVENLKKEEHFVKVPEESTNLITHKNKVHDKSAEKAVEDIEENLRKIFPDVEELEGDEQENTPICSNVVANSLEEQNIGCCKETCKPSAGQETCKVQSSSDCSQEQCKNLEEILLDKEEVAESRKNYEDSIEYRQAYQIDENNVLLQIADELLEIVVTKQKGKKVILVKGFSNTVILNEQVDNGIERVLTPRPLAGLPQEDDDNDAVLEQAIMVDGKELNPEAGVSNESSDTILSEPGVDGANEDRQIVQKEMVANSEEMKEANVDNVSSLGLAEEVAQDIAINGDKVENEAINVSLPKADICAFHAQEVVQEVIVQGDELNQSNDVIIAEEVENEDTVFLPEFSGNEDVVIETSGINEVMERSNSASSSLSSDGPPLLDMELSPRVQCDEKVLNNNNYIIYEDAPVLETAIPPLNIVSDVCSKTTSKSLPGGINELGHDKKDKKAPKSYSRKVNNSRSQLVEIPRKSFESKTKEKSVPTDKTTVKPREKVQKHLEDTTKVNVMTKVDNDVVIAKRSKKSITNSDKSYVIEKRLQNLVLGIEDSLNKKSVSVVDVKKKNVPKSDKHVHKVAQPPKQKSKTIGGVIKKLRNLKKDKNMLNTTLYQNECLNKTDALSLPRTKKSLKCKINLERDSLTDKLLSLKGNNESVQSKTKPRDKKLDPIMKKPPQVCGIGPQIVEKPQKKVKFLDEVKKNCETKVDSVNRSSMEKQGKPPTIFKSESIVSKSNKRKLLFAGEKKDYGEKQPNYVDNLPNVPFKKQKTGSIISVPQSNTTELKVPAIKSFQVKIPVIASNIKDPRLRKRSEELMEEKSTMMQVPPLDCTYKPPVLEPSKDDTCKALQLDWGQRKSPVRTTVVNQLLEDWTETEEQRAEENTNKRRLSLQEYNIRKRTSYQVASEKPIEPLKPPEPEIPKPASSRNVICSSRTYLRSASLSEPHRTLKQEDQANSKNVRVVEEKSLSDAIELQLPKLQRSNSAQVNARDLYNTLMQGIRALQWDTLSTARMREDAELMRRFLHQEVLTPDEITRVEQIITCKRLIARLDSAEWNLEMYQNLVKNMRTSPNSSDDFDGVPTTDVSNQQNSKPSKIFLEDLGLEKQKRRRRFRNLHTKDSESDEFLQDLSFTKDEDLRCGRASVNKRPSVDNETEVNRSVMDYSVQSKSQSQLTLVFKRSFRNDLRLQPYVRLIRSTLIDKLAKQRKFR